MESFRRSVSMVLPILGMLVLPGCAPERAAEITAADAGHADRMAHEHAGEAPVASPAAQLAPRRAVRGTEVAYAELDGKPVRGYRVEPAEMTESGTALPGLIVIQEWWGVSQSLKDVCDRLAGAGFVALAPDLYHGELADPEHQEMDKAAALMNALPADRAGKDMSGAVDYLAAHDATTGDGVGVVGFCMGGMLTFLIAANRGDKVKAAVPFYGYPSGDGEPDWSGLTAVVRGHMAENDDFFGPEGAKALEAKLQGLGNDVQLTVHPGTGHAFMGPHNALGTLDAQLAEQIWVEVFAFLHEQLG